MGGTVHGGAGVGVRADFHAASKMRIGRLEIRWLSKPYPWAGAINLFYGTEEKDLGAALAVPETDLFWRAVHQVINEVESETVDGARRYVGNTNQCISAIG